MKREICVMGRGIQLENITANNIGVLKRINNVVLPAKYSEKWYRETLEVGELAKLGM